MAYDGLLFKIMVSGSLGGVGEPTSSGIRKLLYTTMTTLLGCSTFILDFKPSFKREFIVLTVGIFVFKSGIY